LPCAVEAPFNAFSRQHDALCIPDTRVDLLKEICSWADSDDKHLMFWLNGLAGTGKSTIARTIARKYFEQSRLGASFFFSRGGKDVGHANMFVTTVALQLANSIPPLQQAISDAIKERSDILSHALSDQWRQLVLGPLSKLAGGSYPPSYVLVVDALDECNDDKNISVILHLLAEARSLQTIRLRIFLTSRPEIPIRHGFCHIPNSEHQDFVLHNISPSIINHDISVFLEYYLRVIRQERSLDATWPGAEVIRRLVQIASGLFIWAATACRFIREGKRLAAKRLNTILNASSNAGTLTEPDRHLNEIYITVLKNSVSSGYTDEEKEDSYSTLRQILGTIVILSSPLSACSLARLIQVSKDEIGQTLEDLHSIIDVPKDQMRPLRLHHPSFRDFLLSRDRCKDRNFWVEEKQAHRTLAEHCIQLMSASLKKDLCGIDIPGTLIADVESRQVEQYLPPDVQYACLYWIQHLQRSGAQLQDNDTVHWFLQHHLLHWLEALGWMQKLSEGILNIISLESMALVSQWKIHYRIVKLSNDILGG
jgi:hypothetical protein